MTFTGATPLALLAATALGAGGVVAADSAGPSGPARPTALVIDAAAARDGRDLVDPRLRDLGSELRVPRTPAEARTNVRYFAAQDRRLVVAGEDALAAAQATGVEAVRARGLAGALAAARR